MFEAQKKPFLCDQSSGITVFMLLKKLYKYKKLANDILLIQSLFTMKKS